MEDYGKDIIKFSGNVLLSEVFNLIFDEGHSFSDDRSNISRGYFEFVPENRSGYVLTADIIAGQSGRIEFHYNLPESRQMNQERLSRMKEKLEKIVGVSVI